MCVCVIRMAAEQTHWSALHWRDTIRMAVEQTHWSVLHWRDAIWMTAEQTHWGALTASGVMRHWCV